MKKRQLIILSSLFIIVVLIIAALSSGGQNGAKTEEHKKKEIKYVKTRSAHITNHPLMVKANGRVGSSRNVVLIAEAQGKLLPGDVHLKAGTSFKQGQLLCRIDDTEASLKMQARKSGYLTMLATAIPDLKIDYPESFKLWEAFFEGIDVTKDLPELPEIKSVKEKTYLASRNILGEYYSIKADEEMIGKFHIYAPFDGNLVDVFTEFGTVVNPGSQIARIIQTGNLEVEVPLQVEIAGYLNVGDEVSISTQGKAIKYKGRIIRMGRYVNPNTQSIDVFVSIDATAADKMYDGMYVELEVMADTLKNVVKIPRKGMIGKDEIYLVDDTLLIRKQIEVRAKDELNAYISGVENGDHIVVEALSNPLDSMVVHKLDADE